MRSNDSHQSPSPSHTPRPPPSDFTATSPSLSPSISSTYSSITHSFELEPDKTYETSSDTTFDDDDECESESDDYDDEAKYPEDEPVNRFDSLHNIFMLHPNFNSANIEYQAAFGQHRHSFGLREKYDFVKVRTPILDIPIVDPLDTDQSMIIRVAADTGSDIQCFGPQIYRKYCQRGIIQHCNRGQSIRTGNGKVTCHKYIPIKLKTKEGKLHEERFWYLNNLPQPFDWLIGVDLLSALGWRLTQTHAVYEHIPTNVDDVNDELDDLACSLYPIFEAESQSKVDVDSVVVKIPELRSFVHDQIRNHSDLIAEHEWDSGRFQTGEFPIDFIDEDHPLKSGFYSKEYYMTPVAQQEVQRQIDGMVKYRVIEHCTDPQYVSSIFCIPKKTGDVRIVFDYRKLNKITKKRQYPIPDMNELLTKFKDKCVVTSLDLKGGYWHVPIKEEHKMRTAFIFKGKVYQWRVLPFGPMNAPMYFQEKMNQIFAHLDYVTVYLDDISILSESVEEHKIHLAEVFKLLKSNFIKLRIDKCIWGVDETEYLGFIVNKTGINTTAKYIKKIMDVPEPTTRKAVQRFNGLCQYLHRFIPNMHKPLSILSALTQHTNPKRFVMNEEQRNAFNTLKELIFHSGGVRHPDPTKLYHVFVDASQIGIGGMLSQFDEETQSYEPIAYCSKVFNPTQQKWHVSEQELFAGIYCTEKWERLLRGRKFILHTDHKNLQYLFSKAGDFKSGKLFRWAVRLQDFHFECHYVKGEDNTVADWLSRESALLQQPEYNKVKTFYSGLPAANPVREQMSNNGGVDIVALFTNHMLLSVISDNEIHCTLDPFEVIESEHFLTITTSDDREVSPVGSVERMCTENSPKPHIRLDETAEPRIQEVKPSRYPRRAAKERGIRKRRKLLGIPEERRTDLNQFKELKIPTISKFELGSLVGHRMPNPHHKLPKHLVAADGSIEIRNRRASRARHEAREKARARDKAVNQQIIDSKPWRPTWDKDILDNRVENPIFDDYGPAISSPNDSYHRKLLRIKQRNDPIAKIIIEFLMIGNNAHLTELPEYIHRLVLSGRFRLRSDSVLCFVQTFSDRIPDSEPAAFKQSERLLQFAPASYRKSLMRLTHSMMLHNGRSNMLNKLQRHWQYWWPRMRKDLALWCESCNACQHIKDGGYKKYVRDGKLKLFAATRPYEQISVDIVGPLPTTVSGNRYIVSMIDKFSRYCMLVPTEDVTSLSVIKAIDRWITTFGPPKSILSDNGPQFISSVYSNYNANHKIKKRYTSTYHPECNGQIERLHRWIKERLRLISYQLGLNFADGTDDWSDHLGIIQYSYNTSPNRATTYSPQEIILGRNDYQLDFSIIPTDHSEYVDYLAKRQRILHKQVVSDNKKYDENRKKSADRDRTDSTLEIGQKVLWNINSSFTGNKKKFGPRWVGPYEVIDIFNDGNNYKIRVIELPPEEAMKAMNRRKVPRRRRHIERTDSGPVTEFTVPRNQLKPYFRRYEDRVEANESPASLALQSLQSPEQRLHVHPTDGKYRAMRPVQWTVEEQLAFGIAKLDLESTNNHRIVDAESEIDHDTDTQYRYQALLALKYLH